MSDLWLRGVVRSLGFSVHDIQKPLDWRGADCAHGRVLVSHVIAVDANYLHHGPVKGDGGSLVRDGEHRARFQVVYANHGVLSGLLRGFCSAKKIQKATIDGHISSLDLQ